MTIAIYILSFFLVLNCLFLGLLILMQLPKKEAGLGGAAFGGGAVDALIGAGAGNVLTKATKWSAIVFFVLIVSLSLLHSNNAKRNVAEVSRKLEQQQDTTPKNAPPMALPSPLAAPLTSSATPTNVALPDPTGNSAPGTPPSSQP